MWKPPSIEGNKGVATAPEKGKRNPPAPAPRAGLCPASFSLLPPELVFVVVAHLVSASSSPHAALASLARVNRTCAALVHPLLYAQPAVTSLKQLDSLLAAVEHPSSDTGDEVKGCRVEGKVFASKGYGVRVNRVLKACSHIERLEIVGVDDLRAKHLVGQGALTHWSLLNSSFRPNSHPSPPSLAPFLASLTHLTLANVGLPPPSTHLTDILSLCAPHLEHLAISSLRDVDGSDFRRALAVLVHRGERLASLMLGFMTEDQLRAMVQPVLPRPDTAPASLLLTPSASPTASSPCPAAPAPALSLLPALTQLTFTLPLPTPALLLALPPSLSLLTIRPPYHRARRAPAPAPAHDWSTGAAQSASAPGTPVTVFGTSRAELLSVLGRERAAARPPPPQQQRGGAGRRPSYTLEQLEEEEVVLCAVEDALGYPHPANGGWVAPRLKEIRWEGRALRSAEERIGALMERRKRAGVGDLAQ
ncbi:hypothetical protein Rhopal_001370-T1 [Rhodotorula paludigena]|uniref:F-box domain-containing protein n=1 Tax=Rhodotorula paludigena TaxID=86838 RepID=A0AAV5GD52_9BASI|nr:hypothetical protein Rhopal_001370-T1 [Rhodotorula paludigena]